jgi:hypothetical protein
MSPKRGAALPHDRAASCEETAERLRDYLKRETDEHAYAEAQPARSNSVQMM